MTIRGVIPEAPALSGSGLHCAMSHFISDPQTTDYAPSSFASRPLPHRPSGEASPSVAPYAPEVAGFGPLWASYGPLRARGTYASPYGPVRQRYGNGGNTLPDPPYDDRNSPREAF